MSLDVHQANLNYSKTPVKYTFLQYLEDILEQPRFCKQQLPRYFAEQTGMKLAGTNTAAIHC